MPCRASHPPGATTNPALPRAALVLLAPVPARPRPSGRSGGSGLAADGGAPLPLLRRRAYYADAPLGAYVLEPSWVLRLCAGGRRAALAPLCSTSDGRGSCRRAQLHRGLAIVVVDKRRPATRCTRPPIPGVTRRAWCTCRTLSAEKGWGPCSNGGGLPGIPVRLGPSRASARGDWRCSTPLAVAAIRYEALGPPVRSRQLQLRELASARCFLFLSVTDTGTAACSTSRRPPGAYLSLARLVDRRAGSPASDSTVRVPVAPRWRRPAIAAIRRPRRGQLPGLGAPARRLRGGA